LVKGRPWDLEDEKKLTSWFRSGTVDLRVLAFSFEGKYSEEGIRQKLLKLGLLREQQQSKNLCCYSSKLELPTELPSVEETLKTLSAALKSLETPGLDKCEVLRLRGIIAGAKVYKELLTDYLDYRGLEAELVEWNAKFAELSKKSSSVQSK
jgi:hypothetical protein